ncbi:hypothetical protein HPB50_009233 [Hyalomma asiaticum]|uniref:Uncharacterized protein n=1 Tax=Hyalomma asiaticum TaxID=266040 RepID=A0ACB7TBA7_HYAAI|nr:hypothetical protein HPB50_009233 [Hyalomma asiaticum]
MPTADSTIHKAPPAKKSIVVKKEEVEPQPPTAEEMEKVLEQWQAFLDNRGGEGSSDKEDSKEQVRRRLPYHTQRPLRHACLCRLGTCRYDKLPATFKERLHADFGRLEPTQQLRELLGRMYTKGKAKRERNKKAFKEDPSTAAARKGRCKWVYWLPASSAAQLRRKVCKAAFMAVHGITEKRTRDVQSRPENSEETPASLSPRFPLCARLIRATQVANVSDTEPSDESYVASSGQ